MPARFGSPTAPRPTPIPSGHRMDRGSPASRIAPWPDIISLTHWCPEGSQPWRRASGDRLSSWSGRPTAGVCWSSRLIRARTPGRCPGHSSPAARRNSSAGSGVRAVRGAACSCSTWRRASLPRWVPPDGASGRSTGTVRAPPPSPSSRTTRPATAGTGRGSPASTSRPARRTSCTSPGGSSKDSRCRRMDGTPR